VDDVLGFRNGFAGLVPGLTRPPIALTPETVAAINEQGGTVLGTSRGAQDPEVMADRLVDLGVDILVGGDGSMRGAAGLADVLLARGVDVAVIAFRRPSITTSRSSGRASASRPRTPLRPRRSRLPGSRRSPPSTGWSWCA
jgi:hypothetical protein